MSVFIRKLLAILPQSWRASIEAESRQWRATCPHCGHDASIWDRGGVRWKAKGEPSLGLTCPKCGKWGMHKVRKAA